MIFAEAETPILWLHDTKNWLIGKYSDAGKDQGLEEKGMTENKMVGWHHSTMTQWTWVWARSGRWWRTGRPLQSTGLQGIRHDWETKQHLIQQNGIIPSLLPFEYDHKLLSMVHEQAKTGRLKFAHANKNSEITVDVWVDSKTIFLKLPIKNMVSPKTS